MHPSVARLVELMPPRPGSGDLVDWDDVAERSGLRFPADYRDFVAVYGGGTLNGALYVATPCDEEPGACGPLPLTSMTNEGVGILALEPGEDADLAGRISWATDCSANHAFWDTTDPDPDKWPVLEFTRHGAWVPHRGGMADFLVGLLTTPDDFGMAGPGESGQRVFIHWREEQRLRDAGGNPWQHLA
jgi:hypothetical protein